jgi:hypothetical protein
MIQFVLYTHINRWKIIFVRSLFISSTISSQFLVVFNVSSPPKIVPSFYSGKFCARSFTIQVLYTLDYSSSLMRNWLSVLLISSVPQVRYCHELISFHGIEELRRNCGWNISVTSLSRQYSKGNCPWNIEEMWSEWLSVPNSSGNCPHFYDVIGNCGNSHSSVLGHSLVFHDKCMISSQEAISSMFSYAKSLFNVLVSRVPLYF